MQGNNGHYYLPGIQVHLAREEVTDWLQFSVSVTHVFQCWGEGLHLGGGSFPMDCTTVILGGGAF